MEYLNERVSYIRGLVDGLGLDGSTKEGKVILAILDTLEDFADAINELEASQSELDDYVGAIDEDLSDIEDELYDDEYDDDEDDEDDEDYVEVECPHCHMLMSVEEDLLDNEDTELVCPHCNKTINVEDVTIVDDEE